MVGRARSNTIIAIKVVASDTLGAVGAEGIALGAWGGTWLTLHA